MRFEKREVVVAAFWGRGPKDVVVVGQRGEEDAEEETCCCVLLC